MTAATVALCGHRWIDADLRCPHAGIFAAHSCDLYAGHADNAPRLPSPHTCRCGTTTRKETANA